MMHCLNICSFKQGNFRVVLSAEISNTDSAIIEWTPFSINLPR